MTTFELPGEIAMAVIEPPVCCALLVLVQLVALLSVRHMKRPPIHKRVGVLGSILKTVMNGNTSPAIPVMTERELRRRLLNGAMKDRSSRRISCWYWRDSLQRIRRHRR